MNQTYKIYQTCARLPFGNTLFSRLVCFKAPYFASIRPRFTALRPGRCEVVMKKRRAVTNHLKSVHAIAMCNLAELAGGSLVEVSLPDHMRWIPKGMTVSYLKIARTDLRAVCEIPLERLDQPGELPVEIRVLDTGGEAVFSAVITMHLSEKKSA